MKPLLVFFLILCLLAMPIESGDSSNCQVTRESFKQDRASLLQVSANGFDSLQRSDMKAGMSRIVETGYGSVITDAFGEITMKPSERSSPADLHSDNGSDTDAGKIYHESQASVMKLQNSSKTRIVRIIGKLVTWGRVTSPSIWITSTGSTSTSTSTRSSSISSTADTMTSTNHSEEGQKTLGDHDSDLIDDDDSTSTTSISRSNISSSSTSTRTTTMSYYLDEGKKTKDDRDSDDALKDMHGSTSATITSANKSSSSSSTRSTKSHSDDGKKTEDDDNKDLIDDSSWEHMNSKGEDFETTASNGTSITRYNNSKGTSDEDYITDNGDSLQGVAISSTGASTSWNTRTSTTSFTTTSTSMSTNASTASIGTSIADKPSTTNPTTISTSMIHHVSTAASSTVMVGTSVASTTSPATTGTSMGDSVSTSQRGSDSSTASLDVDMKFGGEVDAHGCDGSAGYIWCEAKGKCIRSWEQDCPNNPDHPVRASTTAMTTSTRTSIASTTIISPSDVDDNSQPEQSTGIGIGTTTLATSTISSIASTTMNSKTEIIATATSTTTLRTTWAEDVLEDIEPLDQKDERAGKAKQILARAREMRLRWQQR